MLSSSSFIPHADFSATPPASRARRRLVLAEVAEDAPRAAAKDDDGGLGFAFDAARALHHASLLFCSPACTMLVFFSQHFASNPTPLTGL